MAAAGIRPIGRGTSRVKRLLAVVPREADPRLQNHAVSGLRVRSDQERPVERQVAHVSHLRLRRLRIEPRFVDECAASADREVADSEGRDIEVWSISDQRLIKSLPENNSELPDSQRVFLPYSIDIDTKENIYVTDFGQSRIQKYDKNGKHLKQIGFMGRGLGQFARPKGIAIDKENNLYVVDAAFENVQIFNENGDLLMFFGGPYQNPGNMYLPAQIIIDYDNTHYFEKYVIDGYSLKYLILVTNQFGPDKIGVYGYIEPV